MVGPGVLRAIVRREDAVLDQRSNAFCAKFLAETHMVVALVGAKAPQVACVPQGDLRAEIRLVGPLRTTTNVR